MANTSAAIALVILIIILIVLIAASGIFKLANKSTKQASNTISNTTKSNNTSIQNKTLQNINYTNSSRLQYCNSFEAIINYYNTTESFRCYSPSNTSIGVWTYSGRSLYINITVSKLNQTNSSILNYSFVESPDISLFDAINLTKGYYSIIIHSSNRYTYYPVQYPYVIVSFNTTTKPAYKVYNYIYNGNFQSGKLYGWITNGSAFTGSYNKNLTDSNQQLKEPANITYANDNYCYEGNPWNNLYGTKYFITNFNCGSNYFNGSITSYPFIIDEPFITFQAIGNPSNYTYIALVANNTNQSYLIAHIYTYNSTTLVSNISTFRNFTIPVESLEGKIVRFRVVSVIRGKRLNLFAISNIKLSQSPLVNQDANINITAGNYTG
ncbi:MAG: hypothetical protein ARM1_0041 [Candidatus Micrarchaeota archaeon]|nr:MAG: hypothetical protein ARM1_0041 [Candidatus Micrarchaeota archaeon]